MDNDYQSIIVGNEKFLFPIDMPDNQIRVALNKHLSETKPAVPSFEPPTPNDSQPYTSNINRPGTATKLMTEPFRELTSAGLNRGVTNLLADRNAPPLVQGTVGYAADTGLAGLGLLGTGVSGALSTIPEAFGFFGGSESNKKRIARDVMGMLEGTLPGQAGPLTSISQASKAIQPVKKAEALEAQASGIVPPIASYGEGTATLSKVVSEIPFGTKRLSDEPGRIAMEAEETLKRIAPPVSKEAAGRKIITGINSWMDSTKTKADELYKNVDQFISKDTYLPAFKTIDFLEDIVDTYNTAPNFFAQSGLKPITSILKDLKNGGTIDLQQWKVLRGFRSELGRSISSNSGPLSAGLTVGRQKQLYQALSEDLDAAAKAAGPKAYNAYKRADKYYNARQKRIENTLLNVSKLQDPEQAYSYISKVIKSGGPKESARIINSIRRSLPDDDFQDVSLGIISNLGRVENNVFDPAMFLKEWNKISETGKKLLVSGTGKSNAKRELDNLVSTLQRIDDAGVFEGGKGVGGAYRVRRAASDASQLMVRLLTFGTGGAALGGVPGAGSVALGLASGAALTALSAKAMSSPTFLKALNKMLVNDLAPMNALARSKDAASIEARMILKALADKPTEEQE